MKQRRLWKINCMEYPGMWQRWVKREGVGVGWASGWGYHLRGRSKRSYGWWLARGLLEKIEPGDHIVVYLSDWRVGRVGQVTGKAVEDNNWEPLVPKSRELP